jgi:zinc protease
MAGMIDGFCGRNSIGLRTEFLSDKLYDGFGLFAEVLCNAKFDDKETIKERAQQIETIENQEDNLSSMAFLYFLRKLYGKHPYGLRLLGEQGSVKKLNSKLLKKYWDEHLNPKDLIISVVGDVSPEEIKKLATEWIKLKKQKVFKSSQIELQRPSEAFSIEHIKKGKEQAHIVLGFLGAKLTSPDHYKLSVLNQILAGQGGRLFVTLRDKMSLAYSVNSTLQSGVEPGHFAVYIGTEPSKVETAIKGIKTELEKVTKSMVSEDELARTRQYMVGTYELEQQKNSALASSYAFNELYGLGIDEVEKYPQKILKVTREDILKTAQKYITLDRCVLSVIRPN